MRIGELALLLDVPIQTLRFYEREKLLREPPRTSSGYRAYTEADVARVRFIRDAQSLGFTLKEIRELVKIHASGSEARNAPGHRGSDWPKAFRIAREHLAIIDKKIEELRIFRERLAAGLEDASRKQNRVCPAAAPKGKTQAAKCPR